MKKIISVLLTAVMLSAFFPPVYAADEGAEETIYNTYPALEQYKSIHPRILIDEGGFAGIEERAKGELAEVYSALGDELKDIKPADFGSEADDDGDDNAEQNWMRSVADTLFKLVLMYKITDNDSYMASARDFLKAAHDYNTWGKGRHENNDLACAHMLVALSVYYDWLNDELSDTEKDDIRSLVCDRANTMINVTPQNPWWKQSYLQNHMWVCCAALTVAAAVFGDECDDALNWAIFANGKMATVFKYLADDGSMHEGGVYYKYGMRFLRYYIQTAKKFFGIDYTNTSFVKNTADFMINLTLPKSGGNTVNAVFNFADCSEALPMDYVSVLYFLAAVNQDDSIQRFANYYKNNAANAAMWESLLYMDTSLTTEYEIDEGYRLNRVFADNGYYISRSSWTDSSASAFAFRCGPQLGAKFERDIDSIRYNWGLGHVHPDINSFILYANGEKLILDDGYVTAYTNNHNTMLINNHGQYGDGQVWTASDGSWTFKDVVKDGPKTTDYYSCDEYVYAVGHGAAAYPEDLDVEKFNRHFLYIKPDILILTDDIKIVNVSDDKKTELRFFPNFDTGSNENGSYKFENGSNTMNVSFVSNQDISSNLETVAKNSNKNNSKKDVKVLRVTCGESEWKQVSVFTFGGASDTLPQIDAQISNDGKTVSISGIKDGKALNAVIDIENNKVDYVVGDTVSVEYSAADKCISISFDKNKSAGKTISIYSPSGDLVYADQIDDTDNCKRKCSTDGFEEGYYTIHVRDSGGVGIFRCSVYVGNGISVAEGCKIEQAENKTYASVKCKNNTDSDKDVTIIIAAYDPQKNTLEKISLNQVAIKAAGEEECRVGIDDEDIEGKLVNVYLWDDSYVPLMSIVPINEND